uniref:Integrase catalytic domain-containing protein n=1 Tax=Heligmosomoides polygyrus TaxID=6339 RepID=A0A8L8K0M0_HELPZ
LEKKSELENPKLWDWKRFHTVVDDIISKKELIEEAQITGSYTVDYRSNSEANAPSNRNRRPYTAPECLYCKQTTHRSIECTSVPMPQRAAFFNRNKLCKNCGRPDHRVDTCSKRGCRLCGQKHHTSLHNPGVEESVFDVARFSTLDKLEATAAYVLRFIANTSKGLLLQRRHSLQTTMPEITNQEGTEPLKASNLQQARKFIWKLHQTQFKKAILTSSNNKLNIKKDCDGIYRCYGRLGKSLLSKEAQLPVILAPDTDFAKLVIRKAHGQYHCSVSHTMANVRQQFWIPRLRKQVKMAIRRCIPCQKFNNLPFRYPNVEDLPTRRIPEDRTTLDFASVNVVSSACQRYDVTFNLSDTVQGNLIYLEMPEGARRFLEELAVKTRKNFCEEDVQGLLEYHHDQLGRLLDRGPSLEEEYKQLRLDMVNGAQDRPLQTYKRGCVWLKDILLFIEKLKHIRAETWTLWETYDLLIEANWASTNDYHRFVRKQRRDERPISRTTTSAVCTSEINHWEYRADEFHGLLTHFGEEGVQSQAPETTILQAIEQINGRLCKIEEQLEHRRVQDDNIHEAVRHWEAATNELKESVKRSLEAAANEFREEVRRASRSLSHSSSAESRKRPRRESHDHEDELTRLRRKLNELSNCSERYLGNAEQVVLVHGAVVRCVFCGEKGLHHPDNCPYVRTVETRRSLLTRQGICLRCLGFCNASCQTECSYCRSTRHNTAVCLLPEERQKISAKIAELSSSEAEYRDERDERRREPGKTGTRESHM